MIDMMVIIIGSNRAEMCKVPIKDLNRHFFMSRGQLYKVYPDGLKALLIRQRAVEFIEYGKWALQQVEDHCLHKLRASI